MSILSEHSNSGHPILIVAIMIAANGLVCFGEDMPSTSDVQNSRLLSAHLAVADSEVTFAAATLDQASQRAERLRVLHVDGNASWMEWQQAELQRRQCDHNLHAVKAIQDWLRTETQEAIRSPRIITHASLMFRLPQSDVPIGWLTYPAHNGSPNDDAVSEDFALALLPLPAWNNEASLMLHKKTLEHRLTVLGSKPENSSEVASAQAELRLCGAQLDLNSARAELSRIQVEIVSRLFVSDVNAPSLLTTASAGLSRSDVHSANQILLAAVHQEVEKSETAMLSEIGQWSFDLASRTSQLQKSGFVSTAQLLQHRQQSLASHQALAGAAELRTWKKSWLQRVTENRKVPAMTECPSASEEIHSAACPEISQMSNISVIEMLIEIVRLELTLASEQKALADQMKFCELLHQRLIEQARPNATEVAECERLRRFTESAIASLANRREVLSLITANAATLEASVNQGGSLDLIDSDAMDVLIQSERFNIQANDTARLTNATRKVSRQMQILQTLHKDGLASADEIVQLETQLLQLKHEKQLIQRKQSRSDAILSILTSQQHKLSRSP